MIFSTVFAPQEPALTVGSFAISATAAAADRAEAGDDPVGAESLGAPSWRASPPRRSCPGRAAGRPAHGPAACPARKSSGDGARDRRRARLPGRAPAQIDLSSRSPRVVNYKPETRAATGRLQELGELLVLGRRVHRVDRSPPPLALGAPPPRRSRCSSVSASTLPRRSRRHDLRDLVGASAATTRGAPPS